MKHVAQGQFEIESAPEPIDATIQQIGAVRISFRKTFTGPLRAESAVSMLGYMIMDVGSGAYVALERITGMLDGKAGSFCLQHSSTMDRGQPTQAISVIPDSGTDELQGLRGQMRIDIKGELHFYTFEYEL